MKELVILSGKGGTGKTSLTAAFSHLTSNHILCDADVDGADLHLLTSPEIQQTHDFMGGGLATIDPNRCIGCGNCQDLCQFDAISDNFVVSEISCEGCGICVDFCPEKAIDFPPQKCGEWFVSNITTGTMVHARLGIAQENSGKLVNTIRTAAKQMAEDQNKDMVLIDGPPGIGCPVIAAITGASGVLVVVEPTISGMHDMERVLKLTQHFKLPAMVCINKYDLNPDMTSQIEEKIKTLGLEVVGKIPFNPVFVEAMVEGKNIFEYGKEAELLETVKEIWNRVLQSEQFEEQLEIIKTI